MGISQIESHVQKLKFLTTKIAFSSLKSQIPVFNLKSHLDPKHAHAYYYFCTTKLTVSYIKIGQALNFVYNVMSVMKSVNIC